MDHIESETTLTRNETILAHIVIMCRYLRLFMSDDISQVFEYPETVLPQYVIDKVNPLYETMIALEYAYAFYYMYRLVQAE